MFRGTFGRYWQPSRGLGMIAVATAAFCWGRFGGLPHAGAVPPGAGQNTSLTATEKRIVATLRGGEQITREEFGEYLIARNAEKVELLVNKRIIEDACKARGIDVTAGEVEAALAEDLKGLQVNRKDFVDKILQKYHKSLYEWKEDVIRPKIALGKLARDRIRVTDKDLQDAFEAFYGEKVQCRLILFPKTEKNQVLNIYGELRQSDEQFNRVAKQQASPALAGKGGVIDPIARHTTGNDELEREAFSLRPGEVSRIIDTPQGIAILKCDKRIPADTTKTIQSERPFLEKQVIDKKIQVEIPALFKELHEQAQPKIWLKKATTEEELDRAVKNEFQPKPAPAPRPPSK